MKTEKLWTKDFISVSIVNFVLMLSMYLLLVTMAGYAMEEYSASTSIAGLVASIFILGALIGRLYAGKKMERISSKKILVIGIFIFVFVTCAYFIEVNLGFLLLVRFLHGIGLGLATTATGTIVAKVIPSTRSGEGIGYFSLSVVLSTAIGPFIGLTMATHTGYHSLFVLSLLIGMVSLLISFFVRVPLDDYVGHKESKRLRLTDFFELKALRVSLVMLVMALAYSGILSYVTSYAKDMHLTSASSLFFLVYAVIVFLSRPVTGKWMDTKGGNSVAYPAMFLFAIGMFILSQAQSTFFFLMAAVIIGLGYGNFQSCAQALAIKGILPHRLGLANSTFFICMDLGLGLGPLALGFIISSMGYTGLYKVLAAVILLEICIYYLLYDKKGQKVTTPLES